jgi:anaerobic selenocysteine-containing dehydrogenase
MFGHEVSAAAQSVIAQFSQTFAGEGRRILLHPLPLFNNSVGAHAVGMMDASSSPGEILDSVGSEIRALYMAGSFRPEHLRGREGVLSQLDFLVVQELFENETTAEADVVLPAASYAEQDGTFTNNDGFVQRVRQSIPPLHQSKPDWMITDQLAKELGMDWGYGLSASAVFRELGEKAPAFSGMRYPLLKDETNPIQAKFVVDSSDVKADLEAIRDRVESLPDDGDKITVTPDVGTELFRLGRLTEKVGQFRMLAEGNPRPETTAVSPLYQIKSAV